MTETFIKCPECEGRGTITRAGEFPNLSIIQCPKCRGKSFVPESEKPREKKASYVGAPAIFQLELFCQKLMDAFESYGCYLVGSALERSDWRDVDVRMIMSDEEFAKLFPHGGVRGQWESDPRWIIINTSIAEQMSRLTGLPIDFQIQPATHANERHKKQRSALGMFVRPSPEDLSDDTPGPGDEVVEADDAEEAPSTGGRKSRYDDTRS